jgi:hypothetical protein
MIAHASKKTALRSALLASAAAFAFSIALPAVSGADMALADSHGGKAGQGAGGKGGAGKGGGKGSMKGIYRDITGTSDDGDDSDAPDWAGEKGGKSGMGGGKPSNAGAKKGDLFGDMYVILRDAQGVPILNEDGFVQPIDADGNPIALDDEGAPVDPDLAQEVELGRLNVGRAPTKVLDRRADEVVGLLNEATEITVDAAGRLVLTVDGETKTIDSPLENLAIYVALVTTGTIPGVNPIDGEFSFLSDGVMTDADLAASAAFLAGATDKTGAVSVDEVAYLNAFLGINLDSSGSVTWSEVDYSSFTYDRSDAFEGVTTEVLIKQPDGSYLPTVISVYDVVFGGVDYTGDSSIEAYAQAADDARKVVNFIHEYEVPADSTN